jgi:transcriptional antiterminator NusG
VLINMHLYDGRSACVTRPGTSSRNTPGIIGFIGGERPVPLRQRRATASSQQIEEKKEKVKPKVRLRGGETVKINDGPFLNFNGVIEEVDPERGKLKVSVSIFGRSAPVELEYWQVERG